MKQWAWLAVFIVLCLAVAAVGGLSTASSVGSWYATIRKPAWNPPNWVFGPVWTTLYIMIGIAGWLVWRKPRNRGTQRAVVLWWLQLALNFLWTPLFFGLRQPGIAAIEIVFLWLAIAAFVLSARRVSMPAALLFLPYWIWVTFAAALNYAIWWINGPGAA